MHKLKKMHASNVYFINIHKALMNILKKGKENHKHYMGIIMLHNHGDKILQLSFIIIIKY